MGKYKILTGMIMCSLMVSPVCAYATDSNPLSGSQEETNQKQNDKFETLDNSDNAKKSQPFDIQNEAYTLYSDAKQSFVNLQNQYGSLDESSNLGDGFKSYLKSIREDKENQQLQAKVNQMAQGNYDVKTTENTMSTLADAVEGISDDDKKELMDTQDKENEENDNSYNSDIAFAEGFGSDTKSLRENYDKTKESNNKELEASSQKQIKEFGEAKDGADADAKNDTKRNEAVSDEMKNNSGEVNQKIKDEYKKAAEENVQKANKDKSGVKSFAQSAAGQNKTIQKNYSAIRSQILNVQKLLNSSSKSGSASQSYANKIKNIINKATK